MRKLSVVLTLLAALAPGFSALAAAPVFVPVQGYLTDADGNPVDAEVSLTLKLWSDMAAGAEVFSETQAVLVEDGFFSLYLGGAGNPALDLATFREHGALFLGFAVDGGAELAPRLPLGSVPYAGFAQYAGDAATLGGRPVEDFRLGADAVTWDDLEGVPDTLLDGDADSLAGLTCGAGQVAKWDGAAWACGDDIDTDTQLTEAEVDAFVADNGYALTADLAPVALSGDFYDLANIPVDQDTLAGIACGVGQVIKWSGAGWACADDVDTDTDTQLTEAEVDAFVANNGYALAADLAPVALSGDYNDLLNVPADQDTLAGLTCADGQLPAWDDTNAVWECVDDLDTDTLMALTCLDGQVAKWDGLAGAWACADDVDTDTNTQLTEAEVDAFVADNGYAMDGHNHDAAYVNEGQANSINTGMIVDNTVQGADVMDGSLTLADISLGSFDSRYALVSHNHDAAYVNEGQANSITGAMIVDGAIASIDIADSTITTNDILNGTITGADINTATTITATNFLYATAQTRYLAIAGGQCQLDTAPINQYPFFCQLGASNQAMWNVYLPHGATVLGMQTYFWSNGGTLTCALRYGTVLDGTVIATNTTTLNGGWHWSAESAVSHTVNAASYAYSVDCRSNAGYSDQPVGMIRIRYTVPQPY